MPGKFVGVVKNINTGVGIPGAQMAFSGPSNTTVNRNTNGSYQTPLINPGTYTINATANGYQTKTRSGVTLNDGQTSTQNFQLTPA